MWESSGIALFSSWSCGFLKCAPVERYLAVCHPLKHISFQGKKRNIKILLSTWLFALILTCSYVPRYSWFHFNCFVWPETDDFIGYPYAVGICGTMNRIFNTYEGVLLIVVFLISAAANGLLYFKIIRALRHSGRDILQTSESTIDTLVEVTRVRNQVARTLVINGIVFFVCQIPSRIDNLDDVFRLFACKLWHLEPQARGDSDRRRSRVSLFKFNYQSVYLCI